MLFDIWEALLILIFGFGCGMLFEQVGNVLRRRDEAKKEGSK